MMTVTAMMTALLCVLAPLALPTGAIPLTLATLVIYLSALLLGPKYGTISVALYLLIGTLGLPVFSSYKSGIGVLAGATGGYLVGYLFLVFIAGLGSKIDKNRPTTLILRATLLVAGTAVLYIFGTAWYMIFSGNPLSAALTACVIPFIPGDLIKIAVAMSISLPLGKIVAKFENRPKQ